MSRLGAWLSFLAGSVAAWLVIQQLSPHDLVYTTGTLFVRDTIRTAVTSGIIIWLVTWKDVKK